VVEVEHKRDDAQRGCKAGKRPQQGNGVSASADGHTKALAGMDEAMLAQVLFKRLQHGNIIAERRLWPIAEGILVGRGPRSGKGR
jgi:hypothetical protein